MPTITASGSVLGQKLRFLRAALFQSINPKAWVPGAGAVGTYTPGGAALVGEAAILALILLAMSPPVAIGWTLVSVGASLISLLAEN